MNTEEKELRLKYIDSLRAEGNNRLDEILQYHDSISIEQKKAHEVLLNRLNSIDSFSDVMRDIQEQLSKDIEATEETIQKLEEAK